MALVSSNVGQSVEALRASAASGRIRGERTVVVEDDALAPQIRRGDLVGFVPVPSAQTLRRGDVVQFRHRDRSYLRRYEGLDGTNLVLRDAVGYEDVVPWSDLLGRAVRVVREGEEQYVSGVRDGKAVSVMEQLKRWVSSLRAR